MNSQTFYRQTATAIAAYLMQELDIRPGVHWRIRNATSGPRVLTLAVNINPRYARKIASMSEALSMAAGLDKNAHIRIGRGNRGTLAFEIPKPQVLWFNVSVNSLPRRRGLLASVGLDNEHRPALVDFANPMSPHILGCGATGSGKTNLLKLLTYRLAIQNEPDQVEFVLIDTRKRGVNWRGFEGIPHLGHSVITDENEALRALSWACAEIDRRSESGRKFPHVFVGIDELQALLDKDICPVADEIGALLKDLTATGREFNVHCILGIQNPTAAMMGGKADLKRNVVRRVVGKMDSATAAHVACGIADTGAEHLTGMGDMLSIPDVKRLTVALLTEKDIARLPRAESVRSLDLSQYEDVDHVLDQADNEGKAGRHPDPVEPSHLAFALVYPDASLNEFYRQFSIRRDKARRVIAYARDLEGELLGLDAHVETGTERNEIESEYRFLGSEGENDV